jgi:hypothetical protein
MTCEQNSRGRKGAAVWGVKYVKIYERSRIVSEKREKLLCKISVNKGKMQARTVHL